MATSENDKKKVLYYKFCTWMFTKSGDKIFAKDYGLKAFRIPIYA